MKMKRLIAASALLAGMFSGPALAETLKVSLFLPPKHAFTIAMQDWGEELSKRTNGELKLEIFPAGQLGPPPRQFDLARSGTADIAVLLHAMTPGRFPMTELAGLPLTHPSSGTLSTDSSRRLTELASEYLAAEHPGVKILWLAATPPLTMHLANADPSDLENIKGLRIRYAGQTWAKIVEALGATPVPVPPAEAADAMGKGVVDGATFPFEAALAFDLGPVTKYSMSPGLASATFAVVINEGSFARLSPEHQAAIMETTGPDRAAWFGARWDSGEKHGREYMTKSGVTIVELTEAQQASIKESFKGIVDDALANAGDKGAAFLEAYTK